MGRVILNSFGIDLLGQSSRISVRAHSIKRLIETLNKKFMLVGTSAAQR
jgi:hypothetical protein